MMAKTSCDSIRRVSGIIFPGIQDSFTTQATAPVFAWHKPESTKPMLMHGLRIKGFVKGFACQAARTVSRNLLTSVFSRLLSTARDCADESTWDDAEPVSLEPR